MVAFLALAVVGVDLGRLGFTATEVQTVADVAATAGATALLSNFTTGASADPIGQAQMTAAQNQVDGKTAAVAGGDVVLGNFDFDSSSFSPGGVPTNAVQANAEATVQNLVAGIFGDSTTTVQKTATAAYSGIGAAYPVLPLAIGECHFQEFQTSGNCSDLPSLTQSPNDADNSCWTSLGPLAASSDQAVSYLPSTCCDGGNCGEDVPSLGVTVGNEIEVMNGQASALLGILEDCYNQGIREFLVPVIPCDNCTGGWDVLGFATIVIESVVSSGGNKGIDLSSICETEPSGAAGGGTFGTLAVSMVL